MECFGLILQETWPATMKPHVQVIFFPYLLTEIPLRQTNEHVGHLARGTFVFSGNPLQNITQQQLQVIQKFVYYARSGIDPSIELRPIAY